MNLKQDIIHIGQENGHNIYSFAYKDKPNERYIGVLAQEVEKSHPEAITNTAKGKMVNYDEIGVNFRRLN